MITIGLDGETLAEGEVDEMQEEDSYIMSWRFLGSRLGKGSKIGTVSWIPRDARVLSCPSW